MTDRREKDAIQILRAVLDHAPEERESLLREACGGDGELEGYVRHLLSFDEAEPDPLDTPAAAIRIEPSDRTPELPFSPDGSTAEIDPAAAVADLADVWFSRHCPSCDSRYPITMATCPKDDTPLRDLSIAAAWPVGDDWTTISELSKPLVDGLSSDFEDSFRACSSCKALIPRDRVECPYCSTKQSPPPAPEDAFWLQGLPGRLGGKWRILSRKGGGSFGAFFMGEHHILGMKVGVKVLRSRFTSTTEARSMFHQEALRVSRLNHPNIVKVLDYGEEESRPYLVMELLEGRPLREHLEEGSLNIEEAVPILRQTCDALSAAHTGTASGESLVHLDLKPEHIFVAMVDERSHVKVIDFGIAEIVSARGPEDSESGTPASRPISGTLPYMAPERWDGVADPRCDVYALGVILYEIIAGEPPFWASHPEDFRRLHKEHVPSPPSGVPSGRRSQRVAELDTLVMKAIAKDPRERLQSAEEFERALEAWQKRPRGSKLSRSLRASAIPSAVFALLAALLFYWAPWERLVLSSIPVVLGPRTATAIRATVSGLGHDGARASLILDRPRSLEVALGRVVDREIDAPLVWTELESLGTGGETACRARLRVRSSWGRAVESELFRFELDPKPPEFASIAGGWLDPADEGVLWVDGGSLTVTADEPLNREDCLMVADDRAADPPVRSASPANAVVFDIPRGTRRLTVQLSDRANNVAERTWPIKWVIPPRILSDRIVLTRESNYELEIRLDRAPGRIAVTETSEDGSIRSLETRETAATTYSCQIEFPPAPGLQSKTVDISVWSELSASKGEGPEERVAVEVRRLLRSLALQPASFHEEPRLPRSFAVLDDEGNPIDEDGLDWRVVASIATAGGQQSLKTEIDEKTGELSFDTDLSTLQGKLLLNVVATDAFGNESKPWLEEYGIRVAEPAVTVTVRGEGSDRDRPLFHEECPCRKEPQRLAFHSKIDYAYPDELELRFVVGDPTGVDLSPFLVAEGEGRYSIREDHLLPHLVEGENFLYLVATDAATGESGHGRCSLFYAEPLTVRVSPEPNVAIAEDGAHVEVTVGGAGSRQKTVVIDERREKLGKGGTVRELRRIRPLGETLVEVSVQVEPACTLRFSRRFHRSPNAAQRYPVDVGGEVGTIVLSFHPRDETSGDFWYTPLEFAGQLIQKFRASAAGRRFHDEPAKRRQSTIASPPGATWVEADGAARWLTDELRKSGWLMASQSASLPALRHVSAIDGEADPDRVVERAWREWLANDSGDLIAGFGAAYAKRTLSGVTRLGASAEGNRAPFRVVFEAFKEGHASIPRRATPAKQSADERSER